MKVLVTGKGQLAWELARTVPEGVEFLSLDRDELDITDAEAVARKVDDWQPEAIINAAAYTNVDKAESDAEAAWAVNKGGIENLAKAARQRNVYLLHVSTDFVFDGSANRPYLPDAPVKPLGVYGESKLAGEQALAEQMSDNWAIIRTAWVFSSFGHNFVKTILRLAAEKPRLTIIADQIGSPTWARQLASTCWQALEVRLTGTHHCTCDGVASWYDFALAIRDLAIEKKLLQQAVPILPIPTEAYPTPAQRPHYSVLNNSTLVQALPAAPRFYWRDALSAMLDEMQQQSR